MSGFRVWLCRAEDLPPAREVAGHGPVVDHRDHALHLHAGPLFLNFTTENDKRHPGFPLDYQKVGLSKNVVQTTEVQLLDQDVNRPRFFDEQLGSAVRAIDYLRGEFIFDVNAHVNSWN